MTDQDRLSQIKARLEGNPLRQCVECARITSREEAAARVFNTGRCVCGGTLERSGHFDAEDVAWLIARVEALEGHLAKPHYLGAPLGPDMRLDPNVAMVDGKWYSELKALMSKKVLASTPHATRED